MGSNNNELSLRIASQWLKAMTLTLFALASVMVLMMNEANSIEVIRYIPHEIKRGDTLRGVLKAKKVKSYRAQARLNEMIKLNPHAIKNNGKTLIVGRVLRIPVSWTKKAYQPKGVVKRNIVDAPINSEIVAINEGGKNVSIKLNPSEGGAKQLSTGPLIAQPEIKEKSLDDSSETPAPVEANTVADPSEPLVKETLQIKETKNTKVIAKNLPRVLPVKTNQKTSYQDDSKPLISPISKSEAVVHTPNFSDRSRGFQVFTGATYSTLDISLIEYPDDIIVKSKTGFNFNGFYQWMWSESWESRIGYGYRQIEFKQPSDVRLDQESKDLFDYRLEISYFTSPLWRWTVYSETQQEIHAHFISTKELGLDRTWQNRFGGQLEFTTGYPGEFRFVFLGSVAAILPHSVDRKQLSTAALYRGSLGVLIPMNSGSDLGVKAHYESYNQTGDSLSQQTNYAHGQVYWSQTF